MSSDRDWEIWRAARAAQEREEERRLIEQGDLYALGERRARKALAEDQERHVASYQERVKMQAQAEVFARRQAALEREARERYSQEELDEAARRYEADPEAPPGEAGEDFLAAEARWRRHAEAVARERRRREREQVVTDRDIAAMSIEEYGERFDPETGRPKPGVRYEPAASVASADEDDGVPGASVSEMLAAAGISGTSLDLRRPR